MREVIAGRRTGSWEKENRQRKYFVLSIYYTIRAQVTSHYHNRWVQCFPFPTNTKTSTASLFLHNRVKTSNLWQSGTESLQVPYKKVWDFFVNEFLELQSKYKFVARVTRRHSFVHLVTCQKWWLSHVTTVEADPARRAIIHAHTHSMVFTHQNIHGTSISSPFDVIQASLFRVGS